MRKAMTLGALVALCTSVQAGSPYDGPYLWKGYRGRIISQIRLNEATAEMCERNGNGCYNLLDKHKETLEMLATEYMHANGINTARWEKVMVHKTESGFRISGKVYVGDKAHLYSYEPDFEKKQFIYGLMILDGEQVISKPQDPVPIQEE